MSAKKCAAPEVGSRSGGKGKRKRRNSDSERKERLGEEGEEGEKRERRKAGNDGYTPLPTAPPSYVVIHFVLTYLLSLLV